VMSMWKLTKASLSLSFDGSRGDRSVEESIRTRRSSRYWGFKYLSMLLVALHGVSELQPYVA
jgi:hypothetical protein